MRIRATAKDGGVELRLLMPHAMDTGLHKDDTGHLIPAHLITQVTVHLAGKQVLAAKFGIAVSRDPLLVFRVQAGQVGDDVTVTWQDSRGDSRTDFSRVA